MMCSIINVVLNRKSPLRSLLKVGLSDLQRDRHAGALDRSAFLQRAAVRAACGAGGRPGGRQGVRKASTPRQVQMARAEVQRVQAHRDRVLAEGRHEVGIWSSYGVQARFTWSTSTLKSLKRRQDVRKSFWKAWQSGGLAFRSR